MKVEIGEFDSIVVEHNEEKHHVYIVDQNNEGDTFVLTWNGELMWRGDWNSTLSQFSDIVHDLILDRCNSALTEAASA